MVLALVTLGFALASDEDAVREARAGALLDGPPGCWEVVGRASWDHDLGAWGATRGDAAFVGRLEDGVWGELIVVPIAEADEGGRSGLRAMPRFTPLTGQVRGLAVRLDATRDVVVTRSDDPRVDPVNTVRDVVGRLSGQVETSWFEGDTLHRQQLVGRRDTEVHTTVRFDGDVPVAWDLLLDGTYAHTGWVPARVTALDVRIRATPRDGLSLPRAEAMQFELSLAVVGVRAAQTIRYTSWVPCAE